MSNKHIWNVYNKSILFKVQHYDKCAFYFRFFFLFFFFCEGGLWKVLEILLCCVPIIFWQLCKVIFKSQKLLDHYGNRILFNVHFPTLQKIYILDTPTKKISRTDKQNFHLQNLHIWPNTCLKVAKSWFMNPQSLKSDKDKNPPKKIS